MTAPAETLGAWLDGELGGAPQELAVRIRAVLPSDWRDVGIPHAPQVLVDAAARELRSLFERGCDQRWAAPGVLVVDALVTYACQLVAVSGADIDASMRSLLNTLTKTLPPEDALA